VEVEYASLLCAATTDYTFSEADDYVPEGA
jgi:hypothetical protein